MDYDGLAKDLWAMAIRARMASGLGPREWRMKALAFADDCCDFFFEVSQR